MPDGYGSWEEVRGQLVRTIGLHDEKIGKRASALLDSAAEAARSGALESAARYLQDYRALALHQNLFRHWDQGIIIFGEAIDLLLRMSPTGQPPPAYQRLIDAKPSLSYESKLTPYQRAFWYR